MSDQYERPPLLEAIYEVYARDCPGWSELSYKEIEEQLRARFDGRREELEPVGVQVLVGPGKAISHSVAPEAHRVRLWTKDGGEMFQFAPTMCAYNIMKRYERFASHAADIEKLFGVYLERAKPTATEWAGQRYINRVLLPLADPIRRAISSCIRSFPARPLTAPSPCRC